MITTLKLDPQRKHFAQLVARSRGVTFAALVDELLDVCLDAATLRSEGLDVPVRELMASLWGEHEADRIALAGNRFPELLTERERVIWDRIVCEQAVYWKVPLTGKKITVNESTFDFVLFREQLPKFDGLTKNEVVTTANQLASNVSQQTVGVVSKRNLTEYQQDQQP